MQSFFVHVLAVVFLLLGSCSYAADLTLHYDANGSVDSKTTPSGTTTYTYDALGRINTETGFAGNRNHDFDGNDNRTNDSAGTVTTFAPNSDKLATINGITVTLDGAGRLISDGTYHYVWDALSQLRELRTSGHALMATYYYDGRGLRTRKETTALAPQGISTTYYHYDQQGQLIGESASSTMPLMTYIWNDNILTGIIVHQPTRTVYTVQTDQLGSPFQVRALEGKVVWRWEPEAFGKTLPNDDPDGDGNKFTLNLRFPGQYYDQESGLHYNWHRYYSPKLARYLSPDPIGLAGGANRFSYVNGNPVNAVDPTGQFALVLPALPAMSEAVLAGLGYLTGGVAMATILSTPNDTTSDKSRAVPYPERKRGKYTCICRANKDGRSPDNCSTDNQDFAMGYGEGATLSEAKKAAEKDAKEKLGAKSTHHPQCRCTDPKGEPIIPTR